MSKHRNAENQSAQSYERQLRFGSMLRKLLPSGSRRWITPIVMLLLLLGIVAGAVIVSSVTQRHVQLDDGTVWVTSLKDRKAARFNVRNRDADAGVASTAARFDVAQHDGSTVISEGTKASNIEASTVSESGNTTIKSDMRTVVGGNTAAFINVKTGNVWVGSADDVKSMNPTTDSPKMKLGSGGRIAVTHDGVVYGYRASDGAVLSVDGPQGTPGKDATIKGATNVESFTVVGKTPVAAGAGKVFWPKGSADIGLQGQATLQAPSTDGRQTGWVAVSTPRGIAMVDLGSKKVTQLPNAGKGDAAQPVSTNGCVFAAWAQKVNNYIRVCAANDKDAQFSSLEDVNPTSQLVFRTNHRLVVLNDVVNGNVWNPQESTKVIKIQWNKVETKQSKQQQQNNDSANNQHNFSKNCSAQSGQIKAVDDSFGARVGSQQILDVLRNDEQTDCSVLRITSVSAPDGANITVSPVYDGRYLQLDDTSWGEFCSAEKRKAYAERGIDVDEVGRKYVYVLNKILEAKPEDMVITMHICRGNFRSTWSSTGGYEPVAEILFGHCNVDGFFLEYDSDRAGGFEPLRYIGKQKVVLGLVTSKDAKLENKEDVIARIREASKYVPLEQLALSPQCGFASTEEGNLVTDEDQWSKLALVKEIAEEVWAD